MKVRTVKRAKSMVKRRRRRARVAGMRQRRVQGRSILSMSRLRDPGIREFISSWPEYPRVCAKYEKVLLEFVLDVGVDVDVEVGDGHCN